jgi:hypothetical protein
VEKLWMKACAAISNRPVRDWTGKDHHEKCPFFIVFSAEMAMATPVL